jgi:putative drug exporter of the RND superfamily
MARVALDNLTHSGIGSGPLSPFDALVKTGDPAPIANTFATVEGVRASVAPADWHRSGTALVTVIPTEDGNSPTGRATLDRLRAVAVNGDVAIGGEAAQGADFLDAVYSNFPLPILLISAATFLLLARAFRSLILPLKAVLLNLLSVAAAWGLLVLAFQHGFGSGIWGIEATRAINVEMPIVVFEGIGRTGRLVTSAALILGLAFVAFSSQPGTEAKMFATALGGGILIDATIIRGLLAPALVAILGRWNKLRTASPWVVAQLADIDYLVTDGSGELTRPYTSAGIDVVVV